MCKFNILIVCFVICVLIYGTMKKIVACNLSRDLSILFYTNGNVQIYAIQICVEKDLYYLKSYHSASAHFHKVALYALLNNARCNSTGNFSPMHIIIFVMCSLSFLLSYLLMFCLLGTTDS